jgi:hypothetical protein
LELAATQSEERVAAALRELVTGGESITPEVVARMVTRNASRAFISATAICVAPVILASYDQLLASVEEVRS